MKKKNISKLEKSGFSSANFRIFSYPSAENDGNASTVNSNNLVFWHYKAHNIAQKFIRRIFDIFFFHSIPRSTNLNFSIIFILDQLSKICLIKKIVSKFKSFCQKNEINSARFNMIKLALKILTSSSSARSPSSTATIMVPEMAPFYAVTFLLMKKK